MSEQPRFHLLEPHELEELLFSRKAESTNRVIKSAEYLFKEFLSAKGLSMQKFSYDNSSLDNELKEFFLTIKRRTARDTSQKVFTASNMGSSSL